MVLVIPPCLSKHKCVSLGSWCLSRSSLYISSWAWQAHFWNWFNRPPSNCFPVAVVWLWNGSVQINIILSVPSKQASNQARARTLDWEPSKWVHIPWHSHTLLHTHALLLFAVCSSLCTVVSSRSPSLSIQSHSVLTHARAHHYRFSLMVLSNGNIDILYSERIESNEWMNKYNQLLISFSKQNKPVLCTVLSFSLVLYVCMKVPSPTTLVFLLVACCLPFGRLDVWTIATAVDCFVCFSFCSLQYYHSSLCACVRAIAKEVLNTHPFRWTPSLLLLFFFESKTVLSLDSLTFSPFSF